MVSTATAQLGLTYPLCSASTGFVPTIFNLVTSYLFWVDALRLSTLLLFPEYPEQASWRFELRDQHIPDVVLTKAQQIDILELDKADRLQLAPTALKNWVDLFEHWQEQHIMAQLTHTPVMTVLQSLEQMSQTKEERLWALARERALWDYNTEIQVAEERGEQRGLEKGMEKGREEGMKIFLRCMIETRFGQPLPDWVLSRLRTATLEELQQWGVSLTRARRLEDIFQV